MLIHKTAFVSNIIGNYADFRHLAVLERLHFQPFLHRFRIPLSVRTVSQTLKYNPYVVRASQT